jgi:hypothetical protein
MTDKPTQIDTSWKEILTKLFDTNKVIPLLPSIGHALQGAPQNTIDKMALSNIVSFMDSTKIGMDIKSNKEYKGEFNSAIAYGMNSYWLFEHLHELGYVEITEISNELKTSMYTMGGKISPKGIEVALKIQEHVDNKKRHCAIQTRSTWSLCLSLIALLSAIFAAYFSYERLALSKKNIEKTAVYSQIIESNERINLQSIQNLRLDIENKKNILSSSITSIQKLQSKLEFQIDNIKLRQSPTLVPTESSINGPTNKVIKLAKKADTKEK